MAVSPKFGLTLMSTSMLNKEAAFNEAALIFEALVTGVVLSRQNTAPSTPADGATYIVGNGPSGVFSGQNNKIALYYNGWRFFTPSNRQTLYAAAQGEYRRFNGSTWDLVPATTVADLSDLNDVAVTAPAEGQFLIYSVTEGKFINVTKTVASSTSDLDDWTNAGIAEGMVPIWNGTQWEASAFPTPPTYTLDDLEDVNTAGATSNQVLIFNGSSWVVGDPQFEAYVASIDDVGDVDTAGATPGQNLVWNGVTWVPGSAVGLIQTAGDAGGGFAGNGQLFLRVSEDEQQIEYHDILFEDIGNIDLLGEPLETGMVLRYNLVTGKWEPAQLDVSQAVLGDLSNVVTDGATSGQLLRYNGTVWEPWTLFVAPQLADWKDNVDLATTSPIVIADALQNGDAIDGVQLTTGMRVLLMGQTNAAENGIYTVVATGAASRSTDADTAAKVNAGMTTFATRGPNAGKFFILTTTGTITLGTTPLTFSEFTAGGAYSVPDLEDVEFTDLQSGQFFRYNGTVWTNYELSFEDVLPSISGNNSRYLRVNAAGNGLEWGNPSAGSAFPALEGNAGRVLAVNVTEDDTEWVVPIAGSGGVVQNVFPLEILNPSFESAVDNEFWTITGSATSGESAGTGFVSVDFGRSGGNYLKHDTPDSQSYSASQVIACNASDGGFITLSAWVLVTVDTGADYGIIELEFLDGVGSSLGVVQKLCENPVIEEWVPYTLSSVIPFGTQQVAVTLRGEYVLGTITNVGFDDVSGWYYANASGSNGDFPPLATNAGKILAVNATEDAIEWVDPPTGGSGGSSEVAVNSQAGSYALVLEDAGKLIRFTGASAINCTVPNNSDVAFPVGTVINVRQAGVGSVTVVAGSGVTVTSAETLNLRKQHSSVSLHKVDTNTWDLTGDVELVA